MGLHIPVLETERLIIRPFEMTDLEAIHRILNSFAGTDRRSTDKQSLKEERRAWLEWSVRSYTELEKLSQAPYGDRGVVLKESGRLVGSVGLAPLVGPFQQLPAFRGPGKPGLRGQTGFTTEMGLFWALDEAARGRGYATEAARALVGYTFDALNMARLVATTEYDNLPSQRVMQRLGMRIENNPKPEPTWFQVVGIIEREMPAP